MSANLRLVVQTTQGDATELATKSRSYRFTQRSLTNSRRAVETEDWRLQIALQLDYGEVLQDAVLDLLQTEVVRVELLASALEVEVILGHLIPRQVDHQLQVGHLYRVLGNSRVEALHLCELLLEELGSSLTPLLLCRCIAQTFDVAIFILAQLLLNGAHLLLQVVVALLLVYFCLNLILDVLLNLEQLLLADKNLEQLARTSQQARCLEQCLAVIVRELEIRADEVYDTSARVDVLNRKRSLLRHRRRSVDNVEGNILDRLNQCVELHAVLLGCRVEQRSYLRFEEWLGRNVLAHLYLLQSREDDGEISVWHLENLQDASRSTDAVHIIRSRGFNLGILLQNSSEETVLGLYGTYKGDALLATHGNRCDCTREEYRTAQSQYRQNFRKLHILYDVVLSARNDWNDLMFLVGDVGRKAQIIKNIVIIFLSHNVLSYLIRLLCVRGSVYVRT